MVDIWVDEVSLKFIQCIEVRNVVREESYAIFWQQVSTSSNTFEVYDLNRTMST